MTNQTPNRAKQLANWYAQHGAVYATAGVYDDGVIVYLCVSPDSEHRINDALQAIGDDYEYEVARSDDGFCVVYILPSTHWEDALTVINPRRGRKAPSVSVAD